MILKEHWSGVENVFEVGMSFRSPGKRCQGLIIVVVNSKVLFCWQLIDNMAAVLLI